MENKLKVKEDLRIVKSKRDLCNALKELMLTVPFGKITVGDVCEKALINRMTFYRHYKDKYELLNDVLQNVQRSVTERVEKSLPEKASQQELDLVFLILDAVIEECVVQKKFLSVAKNDEMVLTMIATTLEKAVTELLTLINERRPFRYHLDMLSAAITGATTFLIRHWLMHNPEETAATFSENIKEFFNDLFSTKILFEKV